jgi:hypothetical protein
MKLGNRVMVGLALSVMAGVGVFAQGAGAGVVGTVPQLSLQRV